MPDNTAIVIRPAESGADIELVRELFREYAATIGGHICFQSFEAELAQLPGQYAPPRGCIYLAIADGALAGCIAMRPVDGDACEMKRLYVRPAFRSSGLGRILASRLIADARTLGYGQMNLDTLDTMQAAQRLYESLGFADAEPTAQMPLDGVRYMSLPLR